MTSRKELTPGDLAGTFVLGSVCSYALSSKRSKRRALLDGLNVADRVMKGQPLATALVYSLT